MDEQTKADVAFLREAIGGTIGRTAGAIARLCDEVERLAAPRPSGAEQTHGSPLPLEHWRACSALIDGDCTCGLAWRIRLATEREMHAAWRKRAEEAEAREAARPSGERPQLDENAALRYVLWNIAGTIMAVYESWPETLRGVAITETSPLVDAAREAIQKFGLSNETAPRPSGEPQAVAYDFDAEARKVCEAIGSDVGWRTVWCALHEAFAAGQMARPSGEREAPACPWTEDEDGIWHTGCGRSWFFETGGVEENRQTYCMGCGRLVAATPFIEGGKP